MALKDNLKRLREQAGYSNGKELADTLGIAYPRYMTYERGSWPNEEILTRIATTLHVSMDDLLGYHVDDFDKAAALFHEATGLNIKEIDNGTRIIVEPFVYNGGKIKANKFIKKKKDSLNK